MTVAVGAGGVAGWQLLQRTQPQQLARLAADPVVASDRARLAASPGNLGSAEAIVGDYRTLKVVLTAFGLEADLPNRAFVRKVLESDLGDPASLANRLSDKRYLQLARTLDLGPGGTKPAPETVLRIIDTAYLEKEFERRVGESDPELRLALNARRELATLSASRSSETTRWYQVLGSPPLRKVVEGALGLPASAARAPIDRQLEMFREAAARGFGADFFGQLKDPAAVDAVIDRYLARALVGQSPAGASGTIALTLLRG